MEPLDGEPRDSVARQPGERVRKGRQAAHQEAEPSGLAHGSTRQPAAPAPLPGA